MLRNKQIWNYIIICFCLSSILKICLFGPVIEIVCNIRNLIKNELINYLVNLATYLKIDD